MYLTKHFITDFTESLVTNKSIIGIRVILNGLFYHGGPMGPDPPQSGRNEISPYYLALSSSDTNHSA